MNTPLGSVLGVLYGDAEGFEVVADGVAGRPVLRCLGLGAFLKHHVHQSGDNLLTLAGFGGGLVLQAEDTEHDVIKKLCQSLQITLAQF